MTKISVICANSNHLMGTLASGRAGEVPCSPLPTCWLGRARTAIRNLRAGSRHLHCWISPSALLDLSLCPANSTVAACPAGAGKPGWGSVGRSYLPPHESLAWVLLWAGIQPLPPCLSHWQPDPRSCLFPLRLALLEVVGIFPVTAAWAHGSLQPSWPHQCFFVEAVTVPMPQCWSVQLCQHLSCWPG